MTNLIQILLDAGILFAYCEGVFREKSAKRAKDLILFPIIAFICMITRMHLIVGGHTAELFPSQGYEIAPANGVYVLLFLILAIAVISSVYYKLSDSGYIFCGTMVVFSLYLLSRTISVAVFSLCDATGNIFLLGSRLLSLILTIFLLWTPAIGWLRQTIKNGGFIIWLVSVNITAVIIVVLSFLSFDTNQFIEKLWIIATLLCFMVIFDSGMLYYNQRKMQERKQIHMIEQYVPIVEELISQVRARQHEFNNRIFAIDAAIQSAETLEEAKQNVAALTTGVSLDSNDSELLACDSKIIAGMLYGKIKQAEFLNVNVEVTIHSLFKKSSTPETEWIEVIGILFDNALEATQSGDTIYVQSKQNGNNLELTVSNPAMPLSNVEFMRLFNKGVTSKKDKALHGFGLYNILCITERHHGKILTRNEQIGEENYVVFGVLLP